ncbi:hypothetical protein SCUP234_00406 [Seiridium cupressi]
MVGGLIVAVVVAVIAMAFTVFAISGVVTAASFIMINHHSGFSVYDRYLHRYVAFVDVNSLKHVLEHLFELWGQVLYALSKFQDPIAIFEASQKRFRC